MGLLRLGFIFLLVIRTLDGITITQNDQVSKTQLITQRDETVTLKCNHDDSSYYYMYWYRQRSQGEMTLVAISLGKDTVETVAPFTDTKHIMKRPKIEESSLEIKDLVEEDSGIYFCASSIISSTYPAYFGSGTKLTVLDPNFKVSEQQNLNVTIIKPSDKESCKPTVTLVCVAKNFYPDHVTITWTVGGQELREGVATDPHATPQGPGSFTISSRLKVSRREWNNPDTGFTCKLKFYNGKEYLYKENTVYGIAGSGFTREDYVNSSQMIKLSYGVFIAKSALYGLVIFVYVWRKGSGK